MSQFSYNGVILPYFHCTEFKQIAVRDEMSDTDWYLTRFHITGSAVVNADYAELLAPDVIDQLGIIPVPDSAAFMMDVIRPRLLQHRRTLSYKFNGVELIPQIQVGNTGTVDAENGPKPQSCEILHLHDNMFYIVFSIHASYWENTRGVTTTFAPNPSVNNPAGNPVLYNRWTESADINELNFVSKVRNGKFKIRSDNTEGFIADQLRIQMAQLGVPNGCLRYNSQYRQTPDGLAIEYQVEDRQVFKYPPSPAYKATGEFYETGGKGDATRFVEAWVRLDGSPTTPQSELLNTCMAVVGSKLLLNSINDIRPPFSGAFTGNEVTTTGYVTIGASVRVGMYENWVQVWLKRQLTGTTRRYRGLAMLDKTVCFTPFSDAGGELGFTGAPQPNYPTYGNAIVSPLLQAAAYYDPNLRNAKINPKTLQMNVGEIPGEGG